MKERRRLQRENAALRASVAKRDRGLRDLEEQIRGLNQRRQDVTKRLDELVGRIASLDAQLEAGMARRDAAEGSA